MRMLPWTRPIIPMTARKVDVFPAPFRPMRVTSSPLPTLRLMPCSTSDSPYQACRSEMPSSSSPSRERSAMAGTHVGFLHGRIAGDLRIGTLSEDAAPGQDRDHVRQPRHHRDVVLDL